MKNAGQHAKRLATFLKTIRKQEALPFPELDPLTRLVTGFLQWNAGRKPADIAYGKIMTHLVDHNDLRVSHPREIVTLLGERYPLASERAMRLHDVLQAIYEREHGMTLKSLESARKQDIRQYFESLPGMVPYVAHQVFLLNYDGHVVPVDDLTVALLVQEEVVDPQADVPTAAGFLERNIKAAEMAQVHADLRALVDAQAGKLKNVLSEVAAPALPPMGLDLPPLKKK